MASSSSEQHIKDAMTMSHAQRKAKLQELMNLFGKSGENLSTEEHAIITSQILLTRAGLSADKEYPRDGDDKNTTDLNKVFWEVHFQGYMKCATADCIRCAQANAMLRDVVGQSFSKAQEELWATSS